MSSSTFSSLLLNQEYARGENYKWQDTIKEQLKHTLHGIKIITLQLSTIFTWHAKGCTVFSISILKNNLHFCDPLKRALSLGLSPTSIILEPARSWRSLFIKLDSITTSIVKNSYRCINTYCYGKITQFVLTCIRIPAL